MTVLMIPPPGARLYNGAKLTPGVVVDVLVADVAALSKAGWVPAPKPKRTKSTDEESK